MTDDANEGRAAPEEAATVTMGQIERRVRELTEGPTLRVVEAQARRAAFAASLGMEERT